MSAAGHGTRSAYAGGCRCDACRAANTAYITRYRRARGVAPFTPATHGSIGKYRAGCRCDECRAVNVAQSMTSRRRMRARFAADPTLAPHGTVSAYCNWGCRCDACRDAYSSYQAARRREVAP